MPHTTLSSGFLALCRLIVLSLWLRTNEARRRVALLGPPVSRFGIPISAASRGSLHGTGRATRSEWPLLARNGLAMGQYDHRARRENRKPALTPRSRLSELGRTVGGPRYRAFLQSSRRRLGAIPLRLSWLFG